jgi:hypothetical protein
MKEMLFFPGYERVQSNLFACLSHFSKDIQIKNAFVLLCLSKLKGEGE